MSRSGRVAVASALLAGGCVYFNAFYNARELYDQAETARWEGRPDEARTAYDSVVVKAARSFRKDPDGLWANDALYLLGRAYFRQGKLIESRAALERALAVTDDASLRGELTLHLGLVAAAAGESDRALSLLGEALAGYLPSAQRAEGLAWRARTLLRQGRADEGWSEMDRAVEEDSRQRAPAALARAEWGLQRDDSSAFRSGVEMILRVGQAHLQADSVRKLIGSASRRWGPAPAAEFLRGLPDATWPRSFRDRLLLTRVDLWLEAGDTTAALTDALFVAAGVGTEATDARLLIARHTLAAAVEVEALQTSRPVLMPSVSDPRVLRLLESIRLVEILDRRGRTENPREALFAAAEIARDDLGALGVARSLFLRYSDSAEATWAGKAVLASLDLAADPSVRPPILQRMARLRNDPYVAARSRGIGSTEELRVLDQTLQGILSDAVSRAVQEAAELDVLARERTDTLQGGRF